MRTTFGWLADTQGCGFYRVMLPMRQLRQQGWLVAHSTILDQHHVDPIASPEDIETIVGQRVANPAPSGLWQQMADKRRVYELDDDLLNVPPENPRGHTFFAQPGIRRSIKENIAVADLVTVSTPVLAERVSLLNDNVVVVPNYIDASLLSLDVTADRPVTIGWAGSPTHQRDFEQVRPTLVRLLARHPEVRMRFVGIAYDRGLPLAQIEFQPWVTRVEDYYRTLRFDIGLAPLRPGFFNDAKSHVKALEYAALGIPCVASDEPPYRDFIRHGETGFLVKREHEWMKYLQLLINDENLRLDMGRKARSHAAGWTIQRHWQEWGQAYAAE